MQKPRKTSSCRPDCLQKVVRLSAAVSSPLKGRWAVPPPEPLRGGAAPPPVPGACVPPVVPPEISSRGWWEAFRGPSPPSHLFQSKQPLQTFKALRLLCLLSATLKILSWLLFRPMALVSRLKINCCMKVEANFKRTTGRKYVVLLRNDEYTFISDTPNGTCDTWRSRSGSDTKV